MTTYLEIAGAVFVLTVVLALIFRKQFAAALRVARSISVDERLPRSLRWMLVAGIAVKAFPGPDFGIDEVLLGAVVVLLLTRYRSILKDAIAKERT